MKIAVIGSGIGGLAVALALVQAGFSVEVYERSLELIDQGAGVTLAPNATRNLFHFGLEAALLETAVDQEHTDYRHYRTGVTLRRVSHVDNRERYGAPHLRTHRWDLQAAMAKRLVELAPSALRLGWQFEDLEQDGDSVTLRFNEGRAAIADLVIASDGFRSRVRDQLFGPTPSVFTGYVAWRGLVSTSRLPSSLVESVVSFGGGKNIMRYPVRRCELVNFVAFARRENWEAESWTIPAPPEELISEFTDFDPATRALISQPLHGPLFKWGLFSRKPLDKWFSGRVALLGDAAHPMLPFIGQGGAMAIEDAIVLARALRMETNLDRALARYENARRERAIVTTDRAARQGRMYDGEPGDDSLGGDVRADVFNYDALSVPI